MPKVKNEELDAIRLSAARGIVPGWTPQFILTWNPKIDTPQHVNLAQAAFERGLPMATSRRMKREEVLGWLSENPPYKAPVPAHQRATSTGKFDLALVLDE